MDATNGRGAGVNSGVVVDPIRQEEVELLMKNGVPKSLNVNSVGRSSRRQRLSAGSCVPSTFVDTVETPGA